MAEILTPQQINEEQRKTACMQEIQTSLNKYQCMLNPVFHISSQGIRGDIEILPKPIIATI